MYKVDSIMSAFKAYLSTLGHSTISPLLFVQRKIFNKISYLEVDVHINFTISFVKVNYVRDKTHIPKSIAINLNLLLTSSKVALSITWFDQVYE